MEKKISLFDIYITFFKVGIMTFGGGYAMLPILEKEVVDKKGWVTKEELIDYFAVAQSLPGIIAVNISTVIMSMKKGTLGSIFAVLGVISPCILIITVIAALLDGFKDNEYVRHALAGISVCVAALILNTIIKLWKSGIKDLIQFIIFLVTVALMLWLNISPIFYVLAGIAIGVIVGIIRRKSS